MRTVIEYPQKFTVADQDILKKKTIFGLTEKYKKHVLFFKVRKYNKHWDEVIRRIEKIPFVKLAEPELVAFTKVEGATDRTSVFRRKVFGDSKSVVREIKSLLQNCGLKPNATTETVLAYFDQKYQSSNSWSKLSLSDKIERTIIYAVKNAIPYCTSVGLGHLEPIPPTYRGVIDLFRNPNPIDIINFRTENLISPPEQEPDELDGTIEGVSFAQMYLSVGGACSSFHQEEFTLASIFWLLRGSEKIWITIDTTTANVEKFRGAVKTRTGSTCRAFLQSKNIICLTSFLDDEDINYTIYVQKPGTVLILAGFVYHAVFNFGVSYGIASNFVDYNCLELEEEVPYCDDLDECRLESHGKPREVFDIKDFKKKIGEWKAAYFDHLGIYTGPLRRKYLNYLPRKKPGAACTVCSRVIVDNMKRHMNIHGEKKFKCSICTKPFVRESNMKRHMRACTSKAIRNMQ